MKTLLLSAAADEIMDAWFENAWMWIIGSAIFIILMAAILRGGEGK